MEDISVRELLKRYPERGYIIWSDELWLVNCAKFRPLEKWEEEVLDYKVESYRDRGKNKPLSIDIYRERKKKI